MESKKEERQRLEEQVSKARRRQKNIESKRQDYAEDAEWKEIETKIGEKNQAIAEISSALMQEEKEGDSAISTFESFRGRLITIIDKFVKEVRPTIKMLFENGKVRQ